MSAAGKKNWLFFLKLICNSSYSLHDSFPNKNVLIRKMKYPKLLFFSVWNVVSESLPIKYLKAEKKKYSTGRLHEYKLNFEFIKHVTQMALVAQ